MSFTIRKARAGDEALIVSLLHDLAEYEKLLDRFHITEEVVARDYLCAAPRVFTELLFEGDKPAGIATWYWTYGSFAARRKLFLCDLFVKPEFRGKRYGLALFHHLAKIAQANDAYAIDWDVLDWNKPSIDFYDNIGGKPNAGWIAYSLSGDALKKMAG